MRNNDGLLANYIASVDKMPFNHAMNFIKFEVAQWREELQHEDIVLDKIGKFSMDKNGAIIFEPQMELNYLTTAYGLSSFVSPEIKRDVPIKIAEKTEETAPVITAATKRSSPDYLKYAAIFIIGLSVIGFGGNALYKDYKKRQEIAASKRDQQQLESKIEKATFIVSEALPSINLDVYLDKKPFHVIGGAFRYPENAIRKVNQLKAQGYEARILGINKWGLTQVAFASYDRREEAIYNLQKIQKSVLKEAWLLIQEL